VCVRVCVCVRARARVRVRTLLYSDNSLPDNLTNRLAGSSLHSFIQRVLLAGGEHAPQEPQRAQEDGQGVVRQSQGRLLTRLRTRLRRTAAERVRYNAHIPL
jgi:hypothetical protein